MRVSVVIPARNEAGMIDACLRAFENQTLRPFEIIIVDNSSTDDTVERALRYSGVRIIQESRVGISLARNAGFNAASGDVIARCDVDTRVSGNWIAEIDNYFQNHPQVIAITGPATFYDVPKFWRGFVGWLFMDSFYWITRKSTGGETLFGSNCAVRREAWDKVSGEVCTDDKMMHEDIDLGQHMARVGALAFDNNMKVGISARPLLHPLGMLKRWRKGLNNYRRHKIWPAH